MLNSEKAQELIHLIQEDNLAEFFRLMEVYAVPKEAWISKLKNDYILGKYDSSIYQRLQIYINDKAHTNLQVKEPDYDIFFSFSSQNKEAAKTFVQQLRATNLTVFFSDDGLEKEAGTEFFDKINEALGKSQHFLLFCTPEAMNSPWVQLEYKTFFSKSHLPAPQNRRFFIVKGSNFHLDLLPATLHQIQLSTYENILKVLGKTLPKEDDLVEKIEEYKELVELFWQGGEITPKHRKQLEKKQKNLKLKPETAQLIESQVQVAFYKQENERLKSIQVQTNPTIQTQEYIPKETTPIEAEKHQDFIQKHNLVLVEGGTFQMGSNEGHDDEKPIHAVTLDAFYMSKYPVTNTEYAAFLNEYDATKVKKGEFAGKQLVKETDWGLIYKNSKWQAQKTYEQHPVIVVSWYGANEYCQYYGGNLPSEAQWEFAARGGNKSRDYQYAGSNDLNEVAWCLGISDGKTHPVGQKKGNELGLYDMSGNVWEWCQDWYDKNFYASQAAIAKNPVNHQAKSYRVLRGGSWGFNSNYCRSSYRNEDLPNVRVIDYGFRFSRTL